MKNLENRRIMYLTNAPLIIFVFIMLAATISVFCANTNYIEVPSWDTKNETILRAENLNIVGSQVGILVPSTIVVKGNLSINLKENEHLWIAVKPYKSIENWWPQTGGPLALKENRTYEGNAFLGGTNGDLFEIGILIIGDQLNSKFLDWINYSKKVNKWPPITEGHQGANHKVSKEEIEVHKYASITVILMDK